MTKVNKLEIGRYILQKEGYKAFTPFVFRPKMASLLATVT